MSATPEAQRCSVINAHAPLLGTAPLATAWVLLEDNGPWGIKAPGTARFDAAPALAQKQQGTETSVLLVRQPGVRATDERRVWVAHVESGQLVTGTVSDPAEVLEWDFVAIATGTLPSHLAPTETTLWLVCTNSSRDACCALVGRPLVADLVGLAGTSGVFLLESSHLGGHRFAPTALSLPSGYVYGRLTVPSATAAFTSLRDDQVPLTGLRGRTNLNKWQQVAEAETRRAADWTTINGVHVDPCDEPLTVGANATVRTRLNDGRQFDVVLRSISLGDHPESCGKAAVPGIGIELVRVTAVAA